MIQFVFTPDEAQEAASAIISYLRSQGWATQVERALDVEAPYRTTIIGRLTKTHILVEAQGAPNYHKGLRELTGWLAKRRIDSELYLAIPEEASVPASTLREIRGDGVGLLIVDADNSVTEFLSAKNPILMISLDESLALGECRSDVVKAYHEFNQGNRKAALREVCEIVEREVAALASKAARLSTLTKTVSQVSAMTFSSQIDVLEAQTAYAPGKSALVDPTLKGDLHSFRSARNLVDHPAKTKRDQLKRERQMPERMLMGPRLVAEVLRAKRQVR